MTGQEILIALVILAIAACPGIWESKLVWEQYPEMRPWIIAVFAIVVVIALFAAKRFGW